MKWVVATEKVSEHVEGVSEDKVWEPVDVDLWTPSLELSLVSVPTVGLPVPSTPVGLGVQALATILVISTSLLICKMIGLKSSNILSGAEQISR